MAWASTPWNFLLKDGGGSGVKNAPANAGDLRDMGVIPGLGRSPEEDMEPTPVSLPGESQEQRSLEGYSP